MLPSGTLEFESGLIAQITASFATAYHRHAQIIGDKGTIDTTYLNHPPIGGAPVIHVRRGPTVAAALETIEVASGNGFLAEAESFARMVSDGPTHWTGAKPAESIDIALTLEALLESARSGAPIALKS